MFVSKTKCDETVPEPLAPTIATVTVESVTHAQEKSPPPQIEVFAPTSQPVPPNPPSNNSIRYIPSLETNFVSLHCAPYPPCPTTHVTALFIHTATPPIEPILTQLYDEHDTSPYLDTEPFEIDEFSSIPSTLLDPQHIRHTPPSDRVSSTEPNTKFMTTEFLQKCTGFRNIDRIIKNLKSLTQNTGVLRDTGNLPILSRGEATTLPKTK